MELSLMFLLFLAGWPLGMSVPILMSGDDIKGDVAKERTLSKTVNITNTGRDHLWAVVLQNITASRLSNSLAPHTPDNITDSNDEEKSISDILQKVNNGVPVDLYGGDIKRSTFRNALRCTGCQWKKSQNGKVPVPYILSPDYGEFEISLFETAMKEIETMTCIQFVKKTTENDYLSIQSGGNCWSYVGRIGGKQVLSLSMDGCVKHSLIQHELMHSLGFYHEHTRSDRDDYIKVMWENIAPADHGIFKLDDGNLQNFPYDYSSVMQYYRYSFSSVSGQPSMVPIPDPSIPLGQTLGITNMDAMKINSLYKCDVCTKKFMNKSETFTYNSTSTGSSCLYIIQTHNKVLLQFNDINFPSSPGCNDTYIKVYDGPSKSSNVLIDKTCGNATVPPLVSSGHHLLIEIVNNQPSAQSSFNASYDTTKYGGTFTSYYGVVQSPGFTSFYPNNASIVYTIMAPKEYKVAMRFDFFWIAYSPTCSIDSLTIIDGPLKTSPILATYCGYFITLPVTVVSTGNIVVLNFITGNVTGLNGFHAMYMFVPADMAPEWNM